MDEKQDITFIIHSDWLVSLRRLPVEQQDKVLAEWVRYGSEEKLEYADDFLIATIVEQRMGAIDASKERYQEKVAQGKTGGSRKKYNDEKIAALKKQGIYTNQQIADMMGCSKSKVDHTQVD